MSDTLLEDKLLVSRAAQGDASAFDALIRKYQNRAYQYAFRLTRDPEEACDVVAETFVRVLQAIKNFKGQSAFTTWLYRILTNCYLDIRKKSRARLTVSLDTTVPSEEGEVARQIEDTARSPYEEAEGTERREKIQSMLARLPDYQRAMIVMYHSEMLSYEEIAEALDLPIGTVKSRLNRARINLRDLLESEKELFKI